MSYPKWMDPAQGGLRPEVDRSFWYNFRMLMVTFLVQLILWMVPPRDEGLRLVITLKEHYERELRLR